METVRVGPLSHVHLFIFFFASRLLSCFWNIIKMMESRHVSSLPFWLQSSSHSAGNLETNGFLTTGECIPLQVKKGWVLSQNHRARDSFPNWFNTVLPGTLSLGWHDGARGWISLSCESSFTFSSVMLLSLGTSTMLPGGQNYLQIRPVIER